MTKRFHDFCYVLKKVLPASQIMTDPAYTLAYGTDASFYRLIPQVVVTVQNESEVIHVIKAANEHDIHLTFRAAGTSVSGQAVTNEALVRLGDEWNHYQIFDNGMKIKLQPGVIGSISNKALAPFSRKIGPDPSSIDAAKIGGIVANNSSGKCCGVSDNTYKTMDSMRIVLPDGSVLDTSDAASVDNFRKSHKSMIEQIEVLKNRIKDNPELQALIRKKFKIKNTTGYSLNALVDFEDPVNIIQHLMVGSEGTLGFVSNITLNTVEKKAYRACAFIVFPHIKEASQAVSALASTPVSAVELLDGFSLSAIVNIDGVPDYIASLDKEASALLIEVGGDEEGLLSQRLDMVINTLKPFQTIKPIEFSRDEQVIKTYWDMRKGLYPSVGGMRDAGKTVLLEDIAAPVENLADLVLDIQNLFSKHNYTDFSIFGHALAGNLHFVFCDDLSDTDSLKRYGQFMDDICHCVVDKYNGSLKAEHGTGRNIAPYVELEWGKEAYELMWEIKRIFDPDTRLSPDVILTRNPNLHLENIKPMPVTGTAVDTCVECGFCEHVCPSRNITFTPRQRIAVTREITRLEETGEDNKRLEQIRKTYEHAAVNTCAGDSVCAIACPLDIDTGEFMRQLRHEKSAHYDKRGKFAAEHFDWIEQGARTSFKLLDITHKTVGNTLAKGATRLLHKMNHTIPVWHEDMPRVPPKLKSSEIKQPDISLTKREVVYYASCASRVMGGTGSNDDEKRSLEEITLALLDKAGFTVYKVFDAENCCGQPFESKGLFEQADNKRNELVNKLLQVSDNGRIPVLCDTSPCVFRIKKQKDLPLKIFEPIEFASEFIVPHLQLTPLKEPLALHITCSARKMGLEKKVIDLAYKLAEKVIIPEEIYCCGFAGDKGFSLPELNESSLKTLRPTIEKAGCKEGISTSRTCEIGLSHHSGVSYRSLFYVLDRISTRMS